MSRRRHQLPAAPKWLYGPHEGSVAGLILSVLPDFCWQTDVQVLTMLEQIDEEREAINLAGVKVALYWLARERFVEKRHGFRNPHVTETRSGARPRPLTHMFKARPRAECQI